MERLRIPGSAAITARRARGPLHFLDSTLLVILLELSILAAMHIRGPPSRQASKLPQITAIPDLFTFVYEWLSVKQENVINLLALIKKR